MSRLASGEEATLPASGEAQGAVPGEVSAGEALGIRDVLPPRSRPSGAVAPASDSARCTTASAASDVPQADTQKAAQATRRRARAIDSLR
jgi:hypothetical protein